MINSSSLQLWSDGYLRFHRWADVLRRSPLGSRNLRIFAERLNKWLPASLEAEDGAVEQKINTAETETCTLEHALPLLHTCVTKTSPEVRAVSVCRLERYYFAAIYRIPN